MYKVFINTTAVYFINITINIKSFFVNNPKLIKIDKSNFKDILTYIKELESQRIDELVFILEDIEEGWNFFKSNYEERIAGGGLVLNSKSEILFIFRNNKWDLPKGHIEKGEEIKKGAVREVEEECGITSPQIIAPLTETYHTYTHKGTEVLKHTYWFLMQYDGKEKLIPQLEEGITKVEWIPKEHIEKCMQNTYGSIADVVKKYLANKVE